MARPAAGDEVGQAGDLGRQPGGGLPSRQSAEHVGQAGQTVEAGAALPRRLAGEVRRDAGRRLQPALIDADRVHDARTGAAPYGASASRVNGTSSAEAGSQAPWNLPTSTALSPSGSMPAAATMRRRLREPVTSKT
nr:hypothetical protein GCM10025699_76910 [Microbacterium flavescens]